MKRQNFTKISYYLYGILQSYRLKLLYMFKIKLSGELIIYPVKL